MARIAGVDIPNDKPVAYSLAYIYGIGIPTGKKICADAKVDPTKRVKDFTFWTIVSFTIEGAGTEGYQG